jgi:hypothetical protein
MANFNNFQVMEPETRDLVLDLMENADRYVRRQYLDGL